MNKTSISFALVGVLILAIVAFVVFKPQNEVIKSPSSQQSENNSNSTQTPAVIQVKFDYKNDGTYQEQAIQVKEGQHIMITVTSDLADEVHFHGYNLSADVTKDTPAVIEFDATKTGRFEIELENSGNHLGVIEVYPK